MNIHLNFQINTVKLKKSNQHSFKSIKSDICLSQL